MSNNFIKCILSVSEKHEAVPDLLMSCEIYFYRKERMGYGYKEYGSEIRKVFKGS